MKRLNITAEMADGSVLTATTVQRDYLKWEATAKARGWPVGVADNPSLWESFLCYAACSRMGLYEGKFESWQVDCAMPDASLPTPPPGTDEDEAGEVEPTPSGPIPD